MTAESLIEAGFNEGWNSVAVVDLKAISQNLAILKSRVPAGTLQMMVVKADAYGHGAVHVARHAGREVDWFGVANPLEGKELRENGITLPILVFGTPHAGNRDLYLEFDLVATISQPGHFEILLPGTRYHIKFDTGMGRVGVLPGELDSVLTKIDRFRGLNFEGIMTHFAGSEAIGSMVFQRQCENFGKIAGVFGRDVLMHASNSGATLHKNDVHFSMIRSGTAAYGFDPNGIENPDLTPAMRWVTRLAQVRRMPAGAGVSYSHSWHLPADGNVGVIPVGYADGLTRKLSNQILLNINGTDYPQAGNITMDQVMIWLGDDAPATGSLVEILGGKGRQSAYQWARLLGTITYEITCLVGNRVKRVYQS